MKNNLNKVFITIFVVSATLFGGVATSYAQMVDYGGLNDYSNYGGLNDYQNYGGLNDYTNYGGLNDYVDYGGLNDYVDYGGINDYTKSGGYYSGINDYTTSDSYTTTNDTVTYDYIDTTYDYIDTTPTWNWNIYFKKRYAYSLPPTVKIVQKNQNSDVLADYYNTTHSKYKNTGPVVPTLTIVQNQQSGNVLNDYNNATRNASVQSPVPTFEIVQKPQTSSVIADYIKETQYDKPQTATVVHPRVYQYATNPTPVVYQTNYTPAYDYVRINQVPYTGTNDVAYVLTLIAVALASVGAVVYFRGNIAYAFAGLTGNTPVTLSEEVKEDTENENENETEGDDNNTPTLSLINDENGPRLSF